MKNVCLLLGCALLLIGSVSSSQTARPGWGIPAGSARPAAIDGSTPPSDQCGLGSVANLTRSAMTPTTEHLKFSTLASDWCITDPSGQCCSAYQCCQDGVHSCCIYYNTYCF
jgi:hypothetical protein